MALVDLHVHSMYSKHPAQWFLQRIGTSESYTTIEEIYTLAKERGMTYVTISDHNTIEGALRLVDEYPDDTFMSVEATTYFPEDGCKIHVLVYDLTEAQFRNIDRIRPDIYELRDYVRQENLAHSVAHATYSINGRLTFETLEKLILLFDVFEEINGARNPVYNLTWGKTLSSLTSEDIDRLYSKHHIEPFSSNPWVKGVTGGSDDHAGLFIARTFTDAPGDSIPEYIQSLKQKTTVAGGKSSDFKSMAFAIYKIACDFSRQGAAKQPSGPLGIINSMLFENKRPGFRNRLAVKRMKNRGDEQDRIFTRFLDGLMTEFLSNSHLSIDEKLDRIYENIATMTDDFFAMILESVERDLQSGDLNGLIKNFSAILPVVFLSAPFFSTLKHLSLDRELITRLRAEFIDVKIRSEKQILWFSDTIHDVNGIAVSLQQLMRSAYRRHRSVRFVAPEADQAANPLPPNVITLPCIYAYTPEFYHTYTMHVASLLKSLELIYQENPDEIIISTPGPIGLLGLLAAKLLGIPCAGVYHADYAEQIKCVFPDSLLHEPVESYTRWFYSFMHTLYVPAQEYANILEQRGYNRENMQVVPMGVEPTIFRYHENRSTLQEKLTQLPPGFTLLWVGRVSKDKNIQALVDLYDRLQEQHLDVNLLILGDGPDLEELTRTLQAYPRALCLGKRAYHELPEYYAIADLLLSPGVADACGMTVLEAQACGVPVLVTNVGGPQEFVRDGETGYILPPVNENPEMWIEKIAEMIRLRQNDPEQFRLMRRSIARYARAFASWDGVLNEIAGTPPPLKTIPEVAPAFQEYFSSKEIRNPRTTAVVRVLQ